MNTKAASLVVIGLLLAGELISQAARPQRALFIGNSYTYFWNLPQSVAAMAESQGIDLDTRQSTIGGANLGQHWRGDRELTSLDEVQSGRYDAVIIQDHSLRAIDHPDSLLLYGRQFGEAIKAEGGRVYLYLTWARKWDPYMQAEITARYTELAEMIDATIVPVGPAWARARELRPDLELYDPDHHHPSAIGTYLTACVFYGVLTGQSPVGLPSRLTTIDQNGELLYLNILTAGDAQFCQRVAEEIIHQR